GHQAQVTRQLQVRRTDTRDIPRDVFKDFGVGSWTRSLPPGSIPPLVTLYPGFEGAQLGWTLLHQRVDQVRSTQADIASKVNHVVSKFPHHAHFVKLFKSPVGK